LKKSITGNGHANKAFMVKTITTIFRLEEAPEYHDTADALGLAYLAWKKKK
jgi:Holliday junction resolvasome RuvABC endonuclease subunit